MLQAPTGDRLPGPMSLDDPPEFQPPKVSLNAETLNCLGPRKKGGKFTDSQLSAWSVLQDPALEANGTTGAVSRFWPGIPQRGPYNLDGDDGTLTLGWWRELAFASSNHDTGALFGSSTGLTRPPQRKPRSTTTSSIGNMRLGKSLSSGTTIPNPVPMIPGALSKSNSAASTRSTGIPLRKQHMSHKRIKLPEVQPKGIYKNRAPPCPLPPKPRQQPMGAYYRKNLTMVQLSDGSAKSVSDSDEEDDNDLSSIGSFIDDGPVRLRNGRVAGTKPTKAKRRDAVQSDVEHSQESRSARNHTRIQNAESRTVGRPRRQSISTDNQRSSRTQSDVEPDTSTSQHILNLEREQRKMQKYMQRLEQKIEKAKIASRKQVVEARKDRPTRRRATSFSPPSTDSSSSEVPEPPPRSYAPPRPRLNQRPQMTREQRMQVVSDGDDSSELDTSNMVTTPSFDAPMERPPSPPTLVPTTSSPALKARLNARSETPPIHATRDQVKDTQHGKRLDIESRSRPGQKKRIGVKSGKSNARKRLEQQADTESSSSDLEVVAYQPGIPDLLKRKKQIKRGQKRNDQESTILKPEGNTESDKNPPKRRRVQSSHAEASKATRTTRTKTTKKVDTKSTISNGTKSTANIPPVEIRYRPSQPMTRGPYKQITKDMDTIVISPDSPDEHELSAASISYTPPMMPAVPSKRGRLKQEAESSTSRSYFVTPAGTSSAKRRSVKTETKPVQQLGSNIIMKGISPISTTLKKSPGPNSSLGNSTNDFENYVSPQSPYGGMLPDTGLGENMMKPEALRLEDGTIDTSHIEVVVDLLPKVEREVSPESPVLIKEDASPVKKSNTSRRANDPLKRSNGLVNGTHHQPLPCALRRKYQERDSSSPSPPVQSPKRTRVHDPQLHHSLFRRTSRQNSKMVRTDRSKRAARRGQIRGDRDSD